MLNSGTDNAAKAAHCASFMRWIEDLLPALRQYYRTRWGKKSSFFGLGGSSSGGSGGGKGAKAATCLHNESLHVKYAVLYEDMLQARVRLRDALVMPSLKEKLHGVCEGIKRAVYNGGNKKALLGFLPVKILQRTFVD